MPGNPQTPSVVAASSARPALVRWAVAQKAASGRHGHRGNQRVPRPQRLLAWLVTHTDRMRCRATFRLVGESGGTAARVSELLSLTPRKIIEAGELLGSRRPAELSKWSLSRAQAAEDGVELATVLGRVLD